MSQAKAYSLMEAYYQVYIEDVNETLDEVTGRGAIDPASNFPNQRERNTRTYADAGMAMTPLERAMRRVTALQRRNDPAANKRANQITNRFIKPTERGVLRAIDAANTASHNERNKFRESVNYESFDLYDLVLDYLISEGIAETEDNAIQIMSSMSDEWIESILDEATKTVMSVTSPKGEQRRLNTTKASGPARTTIGPDRKIDSGERNEILRQIRRQRLGREGISFTPTAERNARKRGQEQVSANRQGTVNMRSGYVGYGLQRKYGISDKDFDPKERTQGIPNKSVRLR